MWYISILQQKKQLKWKMCNMNTNKITTELEDIT